MSSSAAAILFFVLLIPCSLAGPGPGQPQLWHEKQPMIEKRGSFDSSSSLFSKRDDCGTQYGATYVDCGPRGCYQPSLGEICCASTSLYCEAGQFCIGNHCCPDGLTAACCGEGNGCPANVSSYFLTTTSSPAPVGSTSRPVAVSTSVAVSKSSTKGSTSAVAVVTTPLITTSASVQSTTSVLVGVVTTSMPSGTTSMHTSTGVSSTIAGSGAQEVRMQMGIEGIALGVLGIAGFMAGLI